MKRLVQLWTLTTVLECALRLALAPLSAQDIDSDGDGFFDSAEEEIGTDKNNPLSRPFMEIYGNVNVNVNRPSSNDPTIAPPLVNAYRSGQSADGERGFADVIATPPTFLKACDADFEVALAPFTPHDLASEAAWHLENVLSRNGAFINGLDGTVASEDWMIGPPKSVPVGETLSLTFDYFQEGSDIAGNGLRLLIATNYAGGTPPDGTWTDITPANGTEGPAGTWQRISGLTIQGFEGGNVRIAFQYLSSGNTAGSAYRIGIDNICLHQNIFLPPEITSFTADGTEILDNAVFTFDPELQVTANNLARVGFGEFAYRPTGATEWTTLGEDTRTANGLVAIWPITGIPNGTYELAARLWNGPNFTERVHTVIVALDPPPSPSITLPITGLVTEATSVQVRVLGEAGALIKLRRNGAEIESDYSTGSQLVYTASLPLGVSTFTATAENRAGASAPSNSVTVTRELRTPVLSINLNSNTVVEGTTVGGTVSLDEIQPNDVVVTLSSSRANQVNAGPPVTIPAGQLSAPIILTGVQDTTLEPLYNVTITASAPGIPPVSTFVLAADDDLPVLTLSVDKAMISESDGPNAAIATISRDLSELPLTVSLTNSAPTELLSPTQITFGAGQASVSFPLGAVDDLFIDGTQTANLHVLVISQGVTLSQSNTVSIAITDNESPAVELTIVEGYVLEGRQGTLTVRRVGSALDQPLVVTLTGNDNDELTVPASATIPANQSETTVILLGVPDLDAEDTSTVLVTGTAAGHSSAQLLVTVIDQTLADLVVRDVVATEVESDANFQVSYRVLNQGLLATNMPFFQRVVLSLDPIVDAEDLVLSQNPSLTSTLGPAQDFGRSVSVQAPRQAGTYYLFVVTDVTEAIDEISEENNSTTLATTINVVPAYSANINATPDLVAVNNPVTFSGTALRRSGGPAPFVTVNIHVRVGATERVIAAITDQFGEFSTSWNPLRGEGGDYEVGAVHPGLSTAPTQDTFSIITFDTDFPSNVLRVIEGAGLSEEGTITNPTDIDLTNIALAAIDAPPGLSVVPTLPGTDLAPGAMWTVPIQIDADPGFSGNHVVTLRLTSEEGIQLDHQLLIAVQALSPNLKLSPKSLKCSVVRGRQKTVNLNIQNTGGAASGPISVLLPPLAWLGLASPNPLPSLGPGQSTNVSILLRPSNTQPLALNEGTIVVAPATGQAKTIPYSFRVVSDLRGDLEISVVDEFFFFTAAAPKVEGANVVLSDSVTSQQIASLVTGPDGLATFPALTEGWYRITVDSPEHTARSQLVFVDAGELTELQFFVSKQLVTFSWTVEEVQINDTYQIVVESTFQTNVPAPVVTVTPGVIDVMNLTQLGSTKVVNLTLENHGLISTSAGSFRFAQHPFYEITPLISDVGGIPAKSSLIIPVTIRRIGVFGPGGEIISIGGNPGAPAPAPANLPPNAGGAMPYVSCRIGAFFDFGYPCGDSDVRKTVPIAVSGVSGHCAGGFGGGGGGGGGGSGTGGGGSGSSGTGVAGFSTGTSSFPRIPIPVFTPITFPTPSVCDCPFFDEICLGAEAKFELDSLGQKLASGLSKVLPPWISVVGVEVTAGAGGSICVCCEDNKYGMSGNATATASVTVELIVGVAAGGTLEISEAGWKDVSATLNALAGIETSITGTLTATFTKQCLGDANFCLTGSLSASSFAGIRVLGSAGATKIGDPDVRYTGTVNGTFGVDGFAMVELTGCSNGDVEFKSCASLTPRAEVSLELTAGDDRFTLGGMMDFPTWSIGCDTPEEGPPAPGLAPPADGGPQRGQAPPAGPVIDTFNALQFVRPDGQVLAENFPQLFQNQGVCASVRIRLDQEAVMTRSAFRATLELGNEVPDDSLTEVGFEMDVRDLNGLPADDKFNIAVTRLVNLDAIDGTGTIGPAEAGSAQWTLIPRDTAAQTEDTVYTVGGTITYLQGASLFSIPVEAVQITVRPDACLFLKYFHQRDVYSDDPFTTRIEPAVPYALAVLVDNQGAGDARNLTITSAQPEIIENDKGLLIDFEIIATQVAGQPASPSLAANFGDIPAGESKVATWFLRSSLQGKFVDYDASFEHIDGLGDPRISLLKEVEIHEMIHIIQALGDKDDGLPDFLTNDVSDFNAYPDTVHFSDGGTAAVTVHEIATTTSTGLPVGGREVEVVSNQGQGWTYLRIPDPGSGLRLLSATRSDGRDMLVGTNVWSTDRTFDVFGSRPVYENILHLVDCDSTSTYTLVYGPLPGVDSTPPTSMVSALPANSGVTIPLFWTGADDMEVDSFDIFYRLNNGPWLPHLEMTNRTSSIFIGELGNTYDFYSVARDPSGNEEAAPPGPDATTMVNVQNLPPVLTDFPDVFVPEGAIFFTQSQATDPDGPDDDIIYSLTQGPSGIQIDPFTGAIDWVTGEGDGGTQVAVTVVATDSGIPSQSVSKTFNITVTSSNTPPLIQPIGPQTATVGTPLVLQVLANDADVPAQTITFSLANAPTGMSLDPASGLLVWSPDVTAANSSYSVSIVAVDSGTPSEQASTQFTVTVPGTSLGPPVFGPLPALLWLVPGTGNFAVSATDPDGDPVTITADLSSLTGGVKSFVGAAGSGSGILTWDLTGVAGGFYTVPLTATTSGGEITNANLQIRVEPENDYWAWAAIALAGITDPADFGMFADPDDDGDFNIYEMTFLKNPLQADEIPIQFTYAGMLSPEWSIYHFDFMRHASAFQFVRINLERSQDGQLWQPAQPFEWSTFLDINGDLDNDPTTEDVRLEIYAPTAQELGLFRLLAEPLPRNRALMSTLRHRLVRALSLAAGFGFALSADGATTVDWLTPSPSDSTQLLNDSGISTATVTVTLLNGTMPGGFPVAHSISESFWLTAPPFEDSQSGAASFFGLDFLALPAFGSSEVQYQVTLTGALSNSVLVVGQLGASPSTAIELAATGGALSFIGLHAWDTGLQPFDGNVSWDPGTGLLSPAPGNSTESGFAFFQAPNPNRIDLTFTNSASSPLGDRIVIGIGVIPEPSGSALLLLSAGALLLHRRRQRV